MYGYVERLLYINLSDNTIKIDSLDEKLARKFIGGSSLAARILYNRISPNIDPFDLENVLVFMTGPVTGTLVPTSGRYVVCTRSPLTGIWAESHASGFWGAELKFAGFDGIVIDGKAESPVYLWIHNGEVEVKSASHLWGKDAYETEGLIKRELDNEDAKVVSIGIAGEKLVRFASVINDTGRAAGRCGTGAVMGSKMLKAIAVYGDKTSKIPIAKERMLRDYLKRIYVHIRSNPMVQIYASYGTDGEMEVFHEYGDVPIKYFRQGLWSEGIKKISGETMSKTILKKQWACYRCPIACGRSVKVDENPYSMEGAGPEYETCAAFGSLCLNDNLNSIAKANDLCNRYGIDTITTGSVIAFAMECYEKGLITQKDTGGIELEWGKPEVIIRMIHKIGKKEGIGEILSEGVKKAAERIQRGSEDFALHVKGLEIPMHDPRAFKGMGLHYATSHRGACHLRGNTLGIEVGGRIPDLGIHERYERFKTEGKARIVCIMQNWYEVLDSLILCKFLSVSPASTATILSMVTGWTVKLPELLQAGERSWNLKRAFDIRCGISRDDDTLPKRFLKEPLQDGGCQGEVVNLEEMLFEYYKLRGWSENGVPTEEKLKALDLDDVANDLWQ